MAAGALDFSKLLMIGDETAIEPTTEADADDLDPADDILGEKLA